MALVLIETLKVLLFNARTGIVDENKRGLFKSSIEFNYCDYFKANRTFKNICW